MLLDAGRPCSFVAFSVFCLLGLPGLAGSAPAETKTIPVVRITVSTEIAAPPAAAWKQLTEGKNLVTWCPVWKSPGNAAINLAKVGDVLDFTDQWGNGGRSIVTYISPSKELRVAHEPADGSYICQSKATLAASGNGTLVTWVEQYTDESPEADRRATAAKMTSDMQANLAALKKACER